MIERSVAVVARRLEAKLEDVVLKRLGGMAAPTSAPAAPADPAALAAPAAEGDKATSTPKRPRTLLGQLFEHYDA